MTAYYNEIDKYAADWLRNLIAAGHIAPGIVDTRSIEDVYPSDLKGFTQCHFFAGIGVWSLALRRAGWPDDRPVWTGSCPCQPFSAAGKGAGFADERHLWPAWFHLIRECRPVAIRGEQVASADGLAWLDLVLADLEGEGYAAGAVDLCAAGVGAPHIRQRLWIVADANANRLGAASRGGIHDAQHHAQPRRSPGLLGNAGNAGNARLAQCLGQSSVSRRAVGDDAGQTAERAGVHAGGLADPEQHGNRPQAEPANHHGQKAERSADWLGGCGSASSWMANADGWHPGAERQQRSGQHGQQPPHGGPCAVATAGPTNGLWASADWLLCRDGKWRPVEPGTQPLAHGAPARVGRLRAYGNAINAVAAQIFIESAMTEAA